MGAYCYCLPQSEQDKNKMTTINLAHGIDLQSYACKEAIKQHFPGADRSTVIEEMVLQKLQKYKFTKENSLLALSTCPDMESHKDAREDITQLCSQRWGEAFQLGGQAGIPFAGKTGWHKFSNNCPFGSNIIILFAPHIGIDINGKIGLIHKKEQKHSSSCCNAAIKAYKDLKQEPIDSNDSIKSMSGNQDHQMDCIKNLLGPYKSQIQKSKNEKVALIYLMYHLLIDYLEQIMDMKWTT